MKNIVYLSLLSILILPFYVSDANAVSFDTPFDITSVSPNNTDFRAEGTAKDDLGNIYVLYEENGESDPVSLYIAKTDSLGNVSAPVIIDTVVAGFGYGYSNNILFVNGSTIDVFYNEDQGLGDRNYKHKRSTNGGTSWGSEHSISSGDIFLTPKIFVDGDNFYFVGKFPFDGTTQPDGDNDFYFIKSTDAGVNWSTKIAVSDVSDTIVDSERTVRMLVDGSDIFIAFMGEEQATGTFDRIFFTKSTNSGSTWSTPVDLGAGIENHFFNIYGDMFQNPLDSNELIIIFHDITTNFDQVSVKSTDGGSTWGTLQSVAPEAECDVGEEFVDDKLFSVDGTEILYWFCIDNIDQIAFKKSTDFGDTWGTQQLISSPNGGNGIPDLIDVEIVDNSIFIVYTQEVGISGVSDLYYHESLDNGDNFSTAQSIFSGIDSNNYSYLVDENLIQFFIFEDNTLSPDEISVMTAGDLVVNNQPVITLSGANPQQINQGSPYSELGSTCIDPEEGNISGNLVIDASAVNTSVIGSYTVFYDCDDSQSLSATQKTRTINVVDGTSPTIALIGDNPMNILVGSTYIEPSATCTDPQEGDITGSLIVSGDTIVTTSVAVFHKNYNCQDGSGNNAVQVIRTVNVVSQTTGGSSGSGGVSVPTVPSQGAGSQPQLGELTDDQIEELLKQLEPAKEKTIVQEIIQTFFEFQVLDKTHANLQVQSFLANEQLGIRWSTGDDIIIASVVPAQSPFDFTFEQLPVIKDGSGSAISENGISYNLQVPTEECDVAFGFDCVEKIRYSIPVTVNAIINGTEVDATGTILVDLTEEELNPILVILFGLLSIPIVAGVIWKTRGGNNPTKVKDLLR